jgi:uncharacterized protein (TIGR02453 family)
MTTAACVPKEFLAFLRDLAAHNDKAWFEENKSRYEKDVVEPARALVRRLTADLGAAFPHITGSDAKSGGSLTRIFRDTRFGKDKSPYHTHVGMHFWHDQGKKMETPGFFLRIDADEVLVATGQHQPEPPLLDRIRKSIDKDGKSWEKASRDKAFAASWGGLDGESLKRVPAPYAADHPFADDLKRKDFTAFARIPSAEATKPGFADATVARWRASRPLMKFLCDAAGLPF